MILPSQINKQALQSHPHQTYKHSPVELVYPQLELRYLLLPHAGHVELAVWAEQLHHEQEHVHLRLVHRLLCGEMTEERTL